VQEKFQRGVALLHSFWFSAGEKTFREVLAHDPSCAIATWGIASIFMLNPLAGTGSSPKGAEQAQAAIDQGRRIGAKTQRERDYIDAAAAYYQDWANRPERARIENRAKAYEQLAARYSDDDEAQIFYALYLVGTQSGADQTYAAVLKAAPILEKQFAKYPDHPGVAHYLIHSYDYPPIAEKGLDAARRYAQIAPSAPHALHMPSHIFTRVGAWSDSAETNARSAVVAKQAKDGDGELHAMDYMVYAYLQLGRNSDARRTIEQAREVSDVNPARHTAPYALAAMSARYAIERGTWKEAARLQPRASRFPYTEALTHFAGALGAARSGDPRVAQKHVQELAVLRDRLKAANNSYWATEVDVNRLGAAAWTALADGKREEALGLMRQAADMEDKNEKHIVTPGRIVPARELLGEMLLELKRPAEALKEFEHSQTREPNRFRGLYGAARAAAQSGDVAKAKTYYEKLLRLSQNADIERPEIGEAKAFFLKK
jgi:tetratricopeptide (TPR) repeat protein